MAKDGTRRGGARPGAGRKKKSLQEKLETGNPGGRKLQILDIPIGFDDPEAVDMPESIWITQKAMAELFGVKVPDISKHLSNIYDEGELVKEATISKMEIVQREGNRDVKRTPVFYN